MTNCSIRSNLKKYMKCNNYLFSNRWKTHFAAYYSCNKQRPSLASWLKQKRDGNARKMRVEKHN